MAGAGLSRLPALLDERLGGLPVGVLWVGFSGGLDSTVLLHVLAGLPAARGRDLSALHICHGLHPDADDWAHHAGQFAASLGLSFHRCDVKVTGIAEEGVEAAARRARYAAFAARLPDSGILALAHHRDDQVETVLMRLVHGAGLEGLAGMRALRPLRRGEHRLLWRPLLDVPRAELAAYAKQHGLSYIDDPANAYPDYTRNRLRHTVVPALRAAFPQAESGIAAAAARLREEAKALDHIARETLQQLLDPSDNSLACAPLHDMPAALRRHLIGLWLDTRGLPRPPPGIWAQLQPDLLDARIDAKPVLAWRGARLRRFRERLYGDDGVDATTSDWSLSWDGQRALVLPRGLGTLAFLPEENTAAKECTDIPQLENPFIVRARRGGEALQLNGHRQTVKKLLQEGNVPPWQRAQLPLVFDHAGELLSIAGRWNSDGFAQWLQKYQISLHLH